LPRRRLQHALAKNPRWALFNARTSYTIQAKGCGTARKGRARPENRGHPARIVCEILWPILPDEVWSKIRDFNEDTWTGEVSKSWSENGKSGEAIGAVRIIQVGSARIRQDLRGYSNEERFYTYGYFGSRHFPFMTIKQRYA